MRSVCQESCTPFVLREPPRLYPRAARIRLSGTMAEAQVRSCRGSEFDALGAMALVRFGRLPGTNVWSSGKHPVPAVTSIYLREAAEPSSILIGPESNLSFLTIAGRGLSAQNSRVSPRFVRRAVAVRLVYAKKSMWRRSCSK
jgi:hypothetical protein